VSSTTRGRRRSTCAASDGGIDRTQRWSVTARPGDGGVGEPPPQRLVIGRPVPHGADEVDVERTARAQFALVVEGERVETSRVFEASPPGAS
jgi:hypothetical protein